ncbi:MAG: nucleotidyl transferase AbiEii/AbiGii toxin family protein [Kineosporiaceae bacterium]
MIYDVSSAEQLLPVAEVILAIQEVMPSHVECAGPLVVGAMARDLALHYVGGDMIQRQTDDVDVAVRVPSWADFDALVRAFGAGRRTHRIRVAGCQVDVVPFGQLEVPEGCVSFQEDRPMNVLGLAEAMATADEYVLPRGCTVRVPTLAMQAVLKVIAWMDRGRSSNKDAIDLALILPAYDQPRWNEHLLTAGIKHLKAAKWVRVAGAAGLLGREAAEVLKPATKCALAQADPELLTRASAPSWAHGLIPRSEVRLAVEAFLTSATADLDDAERQ